MVRPVRVTMSSVMSDVSPLKSPLRRSSLISASLREVSAGENEQRKDERAGKEHDPQECGQSAVAHLHAGCRVGDRDGGMHATV